MGPLHDPVTWYKIIYTGEQVAQWDFQNNATCTSSPGPAFVLEVPLRNLLTSIYNFVPCDRIVQRAHCELKTRLSDIVSHLRNDCRQSVTQQLQKFFSTMSTACKFNEMPLFSYLSLRLLQSLFKKFENKCKSKHEVHVYHRP